MSNKEIRPGSEKPRRTLSIRERLAMLTAASALGLTSLFPSATSAKDSQYAVQPRVERAGAPDVQVDEDTYSAISPDAIEKTPVPKPTATPVVTEAPEAVAKANIPTPTPTPVATEVFTGTDSLRPPETITYTVATVLSNANIRSGPSTYFEVTGSAMAGDTFKVLEVSEDGKWLSIEFGDGKGAAFIFASLVSTALVVVDNSGPNQGGAVAPPEASRKEQEVTLEQLAEMMDGVTLGGDNPLEFSDENGEKTILEAYVRIILDQTGMSLAELAEIIKNEGEVEIKIPAPNPENPNRSPTIISETAYTISVVPARGIAVNRPSSQAAADKEIQETMILASQPGDLPLSIMNRETGELAGGSLNISSTGTFFRAYVDSDGKLNWFTWAQDGENASYTIYLISSFFCFPEELKDSKQKDGFYSKILWDPAFGIDYENGVINTVSGSFQLPQEIARPKYYLPDADYKKVLATIFQK